MTFPLIRLKLLRVLRGAGGSDGFYPKVCVPPAPVLFQLSVSCFSFFFSRVIYTRAENRIVSVSNRAAKPTPTQNLVTWRVITPGFSSHKVRSRTILANAPVIARNAIMLLGVSLKSLQNISQATARTAKVTKAGQLTVSGRSKRVISLCSFPGLSPQTIELFKCFGD